MNLKPLFAACFAAALLVIGCDDSRSPAEPFDEFSGSYRGVGNPIIANDPTVGISMRSYRVSGRYEFEGRFVVTSLQPHRSAIDIDVPVAGIVTQSGALVSGVFESTECGFGTIEGYFSPTSSPRQLVLRIRYRFKEVGGCSGFEQTRTLDLLS